jgi:hypothetical protein
MYMRKLWLLSALVVLAFPASALASPGRRAVLRLPMMAACRMPKQDRAAAVKLMRAMPELSPSRLCATFGQRVQRAHVSNAIVGNCGGIDVYVVSASGGWEESIDQVWMDSVVNGQPTGGLWTGETVLQEYNLTHSRGWWDQNKGLSANDGAYAWSADDVEYVMTGEFELLDGPAWDESYYGVVCHSTSPASTVSFA